MTRLQQVFQLLERKPKAAKCPAIDGILDEADQGPRHKGCGDDRRCYGTLVAWANLLGYSAAAKILDETLMEEHAADSKLTKIAESHLNA